MRGFRGDGWDLALTCAHDLFGARARPRGVNHLICLLAAHRRRTFRNHRRRNGRSTVQKAQRTRRLALERLVVLVRLQPCLECRLRRRLEGLRRQDALPQRQADHQVGEGGRDRHRDDHVGGLTRESLDECLAGGQRRREALFGGRSENAAVGPTLVAAGVRRREVATGANEKGLAMVVMARC